MNAKLIGLTVWLTLASTAVMSQGFAGLGQAAEGYAVPTPEPSFLFPADHGPHPDFRVEWWYLTAVLEGEDGETYGVQWTLFRSALRPEGDVQVWMGHAGVTTPDEHFTGERLARGGIGQAGVTAQPFAAWIDDWSMQSRADEGDLLDALQLRASLDQAAYTLDLNANGPLVFHGDKGFSIKSNSGQASYYYSQPFYEVKGLLRLPKGDVTVKGQGWLDREWSSQPLDADQFGWDWFSLSFEGGNRLMGFGLRDVSGMSFTYASWITLDGHVTSSNDLRLTPLRTAQVAGRDVPVDWRIELPSQGLDITTSALNDESWQATLFPYWEGPVTASGTHEGQGYLEMTGY